MPTALADVLTEPAIRKIADEGSYERGLEYFRDGNVESLSVRGGIVYSVVLVTGLYSVTLAVGTRGLERSCDFMKQVELERAALYL